MINSIVCVSDNWAIGRTNKETGKGELLFNLKADMQFFTSLTGNHIVAMGENTLLSLPGGKPLKNRINLVLCQPGHYYNNCICFHSFEEILDFIKRFRDYDVYIIGGGMFYKSMLPYCDNVYVTKVQAEVPDATVFFPNLDIDKNFKLTHGIEMEENGYKFSFNLYERIGE